MKILVTGGAGYIGSHTCLALLEAGYDVVVLDNLSNSSEESLRRVGELTGKTMPFYEVDLMDLAATEAVFEKEKPEAVIHFAGLKAVGESVAKPILYYDNNITGTLNLIKAMDKYDCKTLVFSSSATVYGDPQEIPITENCPKGEITNPYGQTKSMIEQILMDVCRADDTWKIMLLRYFNPIGAHESGRIGEDPKGIPNNLLPYVAQVAVGKRTEVHVFGDDYNTKDGTGVRDYIHVVDLADGHVKGIDYVKDHPGVHIYNLGTGNGYSVLEVISAFGKACGQDIPYVIDPRRPGDVDINYADPTKAKEDLGWVAQRNLDQMCEDTWRWQKSNPEGYRNS